ncbi:MAG: hypothetical protein OEO23_13295, partial [Gemmatimonadota bacterium]|nr:hypothetical protein [Gemmatimonadota bacterium]
MYITRFQESSFRPLADFEEDIDVTTGSRAGVGLDAHDLQTWREGQLQLRSSNRSNTSSSQINQAVWLGWNNRIEGSEEPAPPGYYEIRLDSRTRGDLGVGFETTLELHAGGLEGGPGPRKPESGETEEDDGAGGVSGAGSGGSTRRDASAADGSDEDEEPLDLSVVAYDAEGDSAVVLLSDYGPLRRPLEIWVLRRSDLEEDRFRNQWELVLQHFSIPLADFVEVNRRFDPTRLAAVRFTFDRTQRGTVVVDDIGVSVMRPAYRRARLPKRQAEAVGSVH